MLEKIIALSVKNRFLICLFTFFVLVGGYLAITNTPLDAIPDLSDVQVIIYSQWEGQDPETIEDQVTYPLTTKMLAVPKAKVVRGFSYFGFSLVYVIFKDGTDIYWARSRVLEYLSEISGKFPPGVTSSLGPDATGVGWVYQYTVENAYYCPEHPKGIYVCSKDSGHVYAKPGECPVDRSSLILKRIFDEAGKCPLGGADLVKSQLDLGDLRAIQDWYIRYQLMSVPGVAEAASIGGFVKQYQITIDPNKLLTYNIPLRKVIHAVKRSNNQVGGKLLEMSGTEFMIRGLGYVKSLDDLNKIVIANTPEGTPVLIRDVAVVNRGPDVRRGLAEKNGEGEVVGGIIVMRFGENALQIIEDVKKKIVEISPGLPDGVKMETAYDRSRLIHRAIDNLKEKIIEESIIMAIVCVLFLWHIRSALVAIVTLQVGILMAVIVMFYMGVNANIMSLGGIAIAIGVMIDPAIVMIENAHKHLERDAGEKAHWRIIVDAAKEVGPPLFFSILIITVSFLPVFSLTDQSGRLFKPLAFTKTFAMAASALLAITLVPVFMGFFIRGKITPEKKNPLNRLLIAIYHPIIEIVLRYKKTVIFLAFLILAATYFPAVKLGSEFMPPLNEGDILYMPTTVPGISIAEARSVLQTQNMLFRTFPEVETVFGKVGRAETATDPAPLSMVETVVTLKPKEQWRKGMTIESLIAEMDKAFKFPGMANAWTMPIKTRIDMLSTGIKTPIGIKVFGEDLKQIEKLAIEIEVALKVDERTAGYTVSAIAERVMGGHYLDFHIDREESARYGLNIGDIQDIIMTAIGGMNISQTVEGLYRFPINLRYARELRNDPEKLKRVLVPTPQGAQIPLGQLAHIYFKNGPPGIKTENTMKQAIVYVDIAGIDIGRYVKMGKQVINERVKFPSGYYHTWSGQYEYMVEANKRLKFIVPITLLIVFLLLYFNFGNMTESLIVMLSLPFAIVGGIWIMYLMDFNMSVAVWVGFIALSGIAAETGVVMLIYLDISYKKQLESGEPMTMKRLYDAIIDGAVMRVRPKMMTVIATIGGLLPIMWGAGTGIRAMKRIATPMVGGMVSSTVLTLVVIPAIYYLIKGFQVRRMERKGKSSEKR
ncbi:MAG: CusA/CzcA family heavy metal efflux RND transporter [Deltaproteobacteria bacterium]|nr:CusA/CzcA family heavy metal efflux RND transporter [Deltaproteobacteria bacterium]